MNDKELLLSKLKKIDLNNYSIKISKSDEYSNILSVIGEEVTTITYISVIGDDIVAAISSLDTASFSIHDPEVMFKHDDYSLEYDGLFKEVYGILKPLLVIEV